MYEISKQFVNSSIFLNILYKISNFKPLLLFIFFKPIYTIEFFYDQAKIMFCNITTQKDTNQQ